MKNLTLFTLAFFLHLALFSQTAIGPNLNNPRGLIVVDNYAYFLDNNRLERIDLDNPASTEVVIASLNYSSYTLEKSPQGFFIPNTGQNNVDEARINGTNVSPTFNYINGTGGTIGLAFQDEAGDTYFTRNGTSNSAQLRRLTNSPNTSSIVANMPAGVNDILDVATIGPEFYFSTTQGRIYYFNRNNPSAGFTLFLDLGVGAISGIEVTQDFIYYANGSLTRRLRSNGGSPVFILNNANIINIDVKDNKVYGITRFLPNDRLYEWTDPNLPVPCSTVVNIPDANFKAALLANTAINTDGDNEICTTEAAAYNSTISVPNLNITDLTGIEAFVNLQELECFNNALTSLDLTSNTQLINLYCDGNQLTSLDISQNTNLRNLECTNNQLTSLDISANTALEGLLLNFNNLSSLNTSQNTAITSLGVGNNQLASLDLSQNTAITSLNLSFNQFTSIDISQNTAITSLNVTGNPQLTSLNVANGNNSNMVIMTADNNPNLTCIQHDTGFDPTTNVNWLKDATASWSDNCSSNCTSFVNIPDPNFKAYLVGNAAINIDGDNEICITEAQSFTGVINTNNNSSITDLTGIEAFTNLTELRLFNNSLTSLDVSNNTALTVLACGRNSLTSLDVSNNTALTELICSFNSLTTLDITVNTAITQLFCQDNALTSLNVANGNNSNMTFMDAQNNPNLVCVEHDASFDPTLNPNWRIDATATWSDNCTALSVRDEVFENSLKLYPNPANSILTISSDLYTIKDIEIFSLQGSKIMTSKNTTMNINSLATGVYAIKIKGTDGRTAMKKLLVK